MGTERVWLRHDLHSHFQYHLLTVMADNLRNRGPADRNKVNVNEAWELTYWCSVLGCTPDRLRAAVGTVGVMVVDVRRYLSK